MDRDCEKRNPNPDYYYSYCYYYYYSDLPGARVRFLLLLLPFLLLFRFLLRGLRVGGVVVVEKESFVVAVVVVVVTIVVDDVNEIIPDERRCLTRSMRSRMRKRRCLF